MNLLGHRIEPLPSSRILLAAAILLWLLPVPLPARTTAQKKQLARQQFDRAEAAREKLDSQPPEKRRLADYQAALRAYQAVVHLAPTIRQAPESLFRAAQLNQEMAGVFSNDKNAPQFLTEAKNLYEFLLKEYPQNRFLSQTKKALSELEPQAAEAPAPRAPAPPPAAAPGKTPAPAAAAPAPAGRGKLVQVSNIRQWATPNYSRVVIDLDDEVQFEAGRIANPDRIYFDLHNTRLAPSLANKSLEVTDGLLKKVRLGLNRLGLTRVVLEVGQIGTYSAFLLPNPYRLVIDIQGSGKPAPLKTETEVSAAQVKAPVVDAAKSKAPSLNVPAPAISGKETPATQASAAPLKPETPDTSSPPSDLASAPVLRPQPAAPTKNPPASEVPDTRGPSSKPVYGKAQPSSASVPARPARDGHRSLTRVLGLKIGRIVIDPGHGGHDTGTIGPSGFTEKELVLDVAKRLGDLLEERLGSEVIYTREDDTFIPLENRTAAANQKQADLFVSVHANASRDTKARGVETYYLSFTTAQDALEVAARENAVSEKSIHELQDLVKKITLHEKVDESREFAAEVQKSLYTGMARGNTGMRNRGVRKAPFIVLIGANMPSILAEISFVSNPQDERLLKKAEYRQRVAESLFRGIQRYANSLGGVKVAKNTE